jgi:small subunit ribosomal protein S3
VGQKIHPIGLRLGIIRSWDSRWFHQKHYKEWLHEDHAIRKLVFQHMKDNTKSPTGRGSGVSRIEIERADKVNVIVNTAKPGLIIGKKGAGIDELKRKLEKLTKKNVKVTIKEIERAELEARLVAESIVEQLEKRVAFRRAMRKAINSTMRAGAKGIKVQCGGRLAGAEIARSERAFEGKIPLHTLRADIDYAIVEAYTTYGRIGVKVWVYRGDILPQKKRKDEVLTLASAI